MNSMSLLLLSALCLTVGPAFADLPSKDPIVAKMREAMSKGKAPTVQELLEKKWGHCTYAEAIGGVDSVATSRDRLNFIQRGSSIVQLIEHGMYNELTYELRPEGLVNIEPEDEKYTWMRVYRKTDDGKLVFELSLSPQGEYAQESSLVDSKYFAKIYGLCSPVR